MKKRFLLLALIAVLALSFATVLSACNKQEEQTGPVKLEAPTDFDYNGGYITWTGNKVADVRYEIVINDGDPLKLKAPSYQYKAGEDGSFTVSVTAKAPEGSEEYLDSDKVTKMFYKIAAVENIEFAEDATMTWDAVSNATGYVVEYNGTKSKVSECAFSQFPAGTYSVKVKAIRESEPDHVYYTENPVSNKITILESVISDRIEYKDDQIKWNAIYGALNYKVWIDDSYIGIVPTNSMEHKNENQTFSVKVLAVGDPDNKVFDARETASRVFKYLTPATNLTMKEGVLSWDAVMDADGYEIKINGSSVLKKVDKPEYSDFTPGVPTILQIRAYSNDNVYFAGWTDEYSYTILKSPVLQWTDKELDGAYGEPVSWNKIENATGYLAELKGPSADYNKEDQLGFDAVGYGSDFLQVGTYTIRIKALADNNSNYYESKWSESITVVRLAAPQRSAGQSITSDPNDLSKGFTVTFGNVSEASGYRLYKNDHPSRTNNDGKTQITDYMNDTGNEGDTATFALQSIGKAYNSATRKRVLDSLRLEKEAFTITVLATPSITSEPVEGVKYRFGEVDGTSKYTISKNNIYDPVSHTTEGYDLSDLKGGQSYEICVNARGNGSDVLSSKYTAKTTVFRLPAPTNIRILTDQGSAGILKFDEGNAYAESFEYTIDGVKYELDKSGSDNIADRIGKDTKLFMKSIGGVYKNGTYYMDSPDSATVNFTKLQTPAVSTNNRLIGTKIIWSKISNYTQYSPKYRVVDHNGTVIGDNIDVGEFDIDGWLKGGESETYYIYAIGNGTTYINSDAPDQGIEIERLATPNVTIDTTEMAYTWNIVAKAKEYQVFVDGELKKGETNNANTEVYYYRPTFTKVKQEGYVVRIVAVGNNADGLMDSPAFTKTQKTQQLTTPSLTYSNISYDKYFVSEDGNIIVNINAVDGALGYAYVVKGTEVRKTEHYYGAAHEYSASEVLTYSHNAKSSGDYDVYVYAVGGKFIKDTNGDDVFTVDSRSTQSRTITLLGYPDTITADAYKYLNWTGITNATGYNVVITMDGVEYPPKSVTTNKVLLTEVLGDYSKGSSLHISIQATNPNNYVVNSAWYEQEIIAP